MGRLGESDYHVEFDASPWAGGAVKMASFLPVEYFAVSWGVHVLSMFEATLGDCRWQSRWEFLALRIFVA
eukprot:4744047-Pyramimonas_sp.AAC.1